MTNYNQKTRMEKEEINKAIFDVLDNKYKKDCPEAHKVIKELGYKIEKWDGVFHVRNTATDRTVSILVDNWSHKRFIVFNPYVKRCEMTDKFDFVNCLDKPVNQFTIEQHYFSRAKSKAIIKYEKLKSIRWDVEYHSGAIEKAKKDLEKALKDYRWSIEHHTERLIKSDYSLLKCRKEFGLLAKKKEGEQ